MNLTGRFIKNKDTISVPGFYDGNGIYKIRFMPPNEGKWNYVTLSNVKTLLIKKEALYVPPRKKIIMVL
ncbi:DUF5060 domain-containing protein [Chitinophaga sp. W2I13]|uniref:DUF5060 domain-containing protein n=1 Tax=Chitinophaga sp. W2I13 TaxID=3373923 RepID=UPI003D239957